MDGRKFPTVIETAFVMGLSDFCQRKYGFPVPQVFSAEAKYQQELYLVMVCHKYKFWSLDTPVKYFYVYYGPDKKQVEKIAESYRRRDFDVYIRDKCYYSSGAPENSVVITPDFFKKDYVVMIQVLIHESFHQYVHKDDIGLDHYGQYMTFAEIIAEESLATAVGCAGALDYLTEIKQEPILIEQVRKSIKQLDQWHSWYSEPYKSLDEVYKNVSDWQKRKRRKKLLDWMPQGNAQFLSYYIYYGAPQMAEYLKLLPNKKGRVELISLAKTFSQRYWSEYSKM